MINLIEEALIAQALRECHDNQVHAARMLGISRNTLRNRMARYQLDTRDRPAPERHEPN